MAGDEVPGDESGGTGARVRNQDADAAPDLAAMGMFIPIGHAPDTGNRAPIRGLIAPTMPHRRAS